MNYVERVNPPVSKAHCGCTSFHECVITIPRTSLNWNVSLKFLLFYGQLPILWKKMKRDEKERKKERKKEKRTKEQKKKEQKI